MCIKHVSILLVISLMAHGSVNCNYKFLSESELLYKLEML